MGPSGVGGSIPNSLSFVGRVGCSQHQAKLAGLGGIACNTDSGSLELHCSKSTLQRKRDRSIPPAIPQSNRENNCTLSATPTENPAIANC